jgi:aspartyl/asparaginyl beta-hydroxylase (cupin superfamily)
MPQPWKILPRLSGINLHCEIKDIEINLKNIKEEYLNILKKENFKNHSGGAFDGQGWGAIGLITYGGDPYIDHVNDNLKIEPTRLLDQCPYIKNLLNRIPGKKDRVRFMEVKPGTNVYWHYDNNETIDDLDQTKNARLHLPIITSNKVKLELCHQNAGWSEGKLYYGDFSFPHSVFNGSKINRIHLVIDVKINDDLLKMFPKKYLTEIKKRKLLKKFCQRSCNLYRKLKLIP